MDHEFGRRKAYSYLRFSCPEQAKGDSFRRQATLAMEYALSHDLDLDQNLSFYDLGISAFHGLNAETGQLGAMLEAVHIGLIPPGSVILVESLDRISRQSARKALRAIENILETGVSVVTLGDCREYTIQSLDEDPISLLMALLTFIRANEESATKSRRLAAAWVNKRARAKERPLTSRLPGWLRLSDDKQRLEIIPEQAEIVQRIYREALNGRGVLSIMRTFNKERIPQSGAGGRKGTKWYTGSLSKTLRNPAVIGIMTPNRSEYIDGRHQRIPLTPILDYFPSIITKEVFESVQKMRSCIGTVIAKHRAKLPIYNILAKLSFCSLCGSRMSLVSKSARGHYLVCSSAYSRAGCHSLSVRYGEVENTILTRLGDALSGLSFPSAKVVDSRVIELKENLVSKKLDRSTLNAALRALLNKVVVAPLEGTLGFEWRHGYTLIMEGSFKKNQFSECRIAQGRVQRSGTPAQRDFEFSRIKSTKIDGSNIPTPRQSTVQKRKRESLIQADFLDDYP